MDKDSEMDNFPPLYPFPDPPANINIDNNNDPMLMFDDNPLNMELPGLPLSISEPTQSGVVINQAQFGDDDNDVGGLTDEILNSDIYSDPYILGLINEPIENVCGNYVGESSSTSTGQMINVQENVCTDFENPMKITTWTVSPEPYVCSGCQLLREIKFYNGKNRRNLAVHGRIGSVYHAILDQFDCGNISSENHEYLMYEFCSESAYAVENFLVQFCEQCKNEGYTLEPDPLSKFYETLYIGLNEIVASDYNTSFQSSSMDIMDPGDLNPNQQDSGNNGKETVIESSQGGRQEKTFLAAQRERTGKMTLGDFSDYFHLPMTDAAKLMNVCPTVIKKKCRAGGLPRWPHRKIKGIRNRILKKKEELRSASFEEKANILAELQMLEQEMATTIGKQ